MVVLILVHVIPVQESEGPDYHVAYRDLVQPLKQSTKVNVCPVMCPLGPDGWTVAMRMESGREGTWALGWA